MKMDIISAHINEITPYPKNAKKHPPEQIKQIADSIMKFGFNQSIVVDKDGVIIVGHGRYEAAKLMKLNEVPIVILDLSEEQARAYRLADNKLNESDWDIDLAIEELKLLSPEMLELTGFDKDTIDLNFNFQNQELNPDETEPSVKKCPNCNYEL